MNSEDLNFLYRFIDFPTLPTPPSAEEFISYFGGSDVQEIINKLLQDAIESRSEDDLGAVLIPLFYFRAYDVDSDLTNLVQQDWHHSHEDLISLLEEVGDAKALPAYIWATQNVPPDREFDESRALAIKAIWAMSRIPGERVDQELLRLSCSEHEGISTVARERLAKREALRDVSGTSGSSPDM